jgi:hypothetical protein
MKSDCGGHYSTVSLKLFLALLLETVEQQDQNYDLNYQAECGEQPVGVVQLRQVFHSTTAFWTYKASLSLTPPLLKPVGSAVALKTKRAKQGFQRLKKMEHCKNPWKDSCKSENIKLYIEIKGEKLPICQQCWNNIADQEAEW